MKPQRSVGHHRLYQCEFNGNNRRRGERDSLTVQWLGVCTVQETQLSPWSKKIPDAIEQQSLYHNHWSPRALGPFCCNCALQQEKLLSARSPPRQQGRPSLTATTESLHGATKTECSQDKWTNKRERKEKKKKYPRNMTDKFLNYLK